MGEKITLEKFPATPKLDDVLYSANMSLVKQGVGPDSPIMNFLNAFQNSDGLKYLTILAARNSGDGILGLMFVLALGIALGLKLSSGDFEVEAMPDGFKASKLLPQQADGGISVIQSQGEA